MKASVVRASPMLEVTDLVKKYHGRRVVDGVTFTVRRGSICALLGPNGAGKTTTLEVCEGFRRRDGGGVRTVGLDPDTDLDHIRPRVGVMLQSGGIGPNARCGELLDLTAAFYAHPLPTDALLAMLGLTELVHTPFRQMSGGEQQRLSLAMAIVGRPELVFLDEPTAGLDPQARRMIWDLIRQLQADGVTIVLTTHYLEEAERLADHVVILAAGRVIAQGTPSELIGGDTDLVSFSAEPGLPLSSLAGRMAGDVVVSEPTPGRYQVQGSVDPEMIAAIATWCAERGVLVDELRRGRPSLEDVFLGLTGIGTVR